MSDLSDILARLDALEAANAALRAVTDAEPTISPNWKDRTCQVCGEPARVIDTERPADIQPRWWNGEGYCEKHADELGVTADDHPHLRKPGPKP